MLVYGDPSQPAGLDRLWHAVARRLARVPGVTADELTELTVAAGQLEQATHDALAPSGPASDSPIVARAHALTAALAAELVRALDGGPLPSGAEVSALGRWLVPGPSGVTARWKLPEGLAFYDLDPAAYVGAARRWLWGPGRGAARAVVLGVRSIGTTLAALVTATLRAGGLDVHCDTVRPTGPPFAREVGLDGHGLPRRVPVLVVDEGPGLSGSSLAAVARAVHAARVEAPSVSLLPSHAAGPGPMAPAWVRALWSTLPRFVCETPTDTRRRQLEAILAPERPDGPASEAPGAEPRPCRRFTRPRQHLRHGRVVARYAGVASALDAAGELRPLARTVGSGLAARADAGFGPPVLAVTRGYVLTRTVTAATSAAPPPRLLADYVARTAGAPLDGDSALAAADRARVLLVTNAAGHVMAPDLDRLAVELRVPGTLLAAATDYDLAAYHWLRRPDGGWWKLGGRGAPVWDHTAVGPQTVAWSLGSAVAEAWTPGARVDDLLRTTAGAWRAGGAPHLVEPLAAFAAAYAAFRLGLADLCADTCADAAEVSAARADHDRYVGVLRALARPLRR